MSCTAMVYVAGQWVGPDIHIGLDCMDNYLFLMYSWSMINVNVKILTTVITRGAWAMWRRWWWDPRDTPAKQRKDIFALTRSSSLETSGGWTSSTSLNTICMWDPTRKTLFWSVGRVFSTLYLPRCNPRYRFWFNFSVENVHEGQRIIFNIVNLSKSKNLFRVGLTPIVRSTSRPRWWG